MGISCSKTRRSFKSSLLYFFFQQNNTSSNKTMVHRNESQEVDLSTKCGSEGEGTCSFFCPAQEFKLRKREKLIHKFEKLESGFKVVKQYSRPAAGQEKPRLQEIRSPHTLVKCVNYLMSDVMQTQINNCNLQELYDFLFDRLRSVRQDMILQTCSDDVQLTVLGACVRFHVVFGHLLANTTTFSKHINFQHQLECMKSCLLLDESKLQDTERSHLETIQCLYLLSNLDSAHALTWAIGVSNRSDDLERCLQIALSFGSGNFVRFFRLVNDERSILSQISVHKYCKLMLIQTVAACQIGYKSPNLKYPIHHLSKLLSIKSEKPLQVYLKNRGFKVENDFVWFGVLTKEVASDSELDKDVEDCYYSSLCDKIVIYKNSLDNLILRNKSWP